MNNLFRTNLHGARLNTHTTNKQKLKNCNLDYVNLLRPHRNWKAKKSLSLI